MPEVAKRATGGVRTLHIDVRPEQENTAAMADARSVSRRPGLAEQVARGEGRREPKTIVWPWSSPSEPLGGGQMLRERWGAFGMRKLGMAKSLFAIYAFNDPAVARLSGRADR